MIVRFFATHRTRTKLVSLLIVVPVASGAAMTDPDCRRDVEQVTAVVKHDYAGYAAKTTGSHAEDLRVATDSTLRRAERVKPSECTGLIRDWIGFFRDRHLSIADVNVPTPANTSPPAPRDNRPSLTAIDDSTLLLRLPSFGARWKGPIDSLVLANRALLLRTPFLVVDVRGNGGGGASSYEEVLRLIYTDPLPFDEFETLASPGNIAGLREFASNAGFPADITRDMTRLLGAMEAHPGEFVRLSAATHRTFDTVYATPRRVGIIVDRACVSACELFVIDASSSKKVSIAGATPTGGVVDYGNVRPITLPSQQRRLQLPMSRSRHISVRAYDNVGVTPDVPLPADGDAAVNVRDFLRFGVRPPTSQQPNRDSLFAAAVRGARRRVGADTCGLTGDGGALVADVARRAQFTVLGEAHGVNDVPRFAGALYCDLARYGYRHLAIEVGHPIAAELERRARLPGGIDAIKRMGDEQYPGAPFYMVREEAQLLIDAVAATGRRRGALWGIDYDIMPEAATLRRLSAIAPPRASRSVKTLIAAAESLYSAALAQRNPGRVFAFSSAESLVVAVRRDIAPARGSEADRLLALIERTLAINAEWAAGRGYASNVMRSENLRRTFLDYYDAAVRAGEAHPKAMIKLGASHSYRGPSQVNTYDVGSLVPEIAAASGNTSVGIMLVGGAGAQQALFDVKTFSYAPAPNTFGAAVGTGPFYAAADSTSWSVFDLRTLRAGVTAGRFGVLPAATQQIIFAFDFLVVLGGSGPSMPFSLQRPAWAALK